MSQQKLGKANVEITTSLKNSASKDVVSSERWGHDRYEELQKQEETQSQKSYGKSQKASNGDHASKQNERRGTKEKNGNQNMIDKNDKYNTGNYTYTDQSGQNPKKRNGDQRKQQNFFQDRDQGSARSQKNKRHQDQELYQAVKNPKTRQPNQGQGKTDITRDNMNSNRQGKSSRGSNGQFKSGYSYNDPNFHYDYDNASNTYESRDLAPPKKTRENSSSTNGTNKLVENSQCPSDPRIVSNNESTTENLSNDETEILCNEKTDVNEEIEENSGNSYLKSSQIEYQMPFVENAQGVELLIDGLIETKSGPQNLQIQNLEEFEKGINKVCEQNKIEEIVAICIKISFLSKFLEENKGRNVNEVLPRLLNDYIDLFKKKEPYYWAFDGDRYEESDSLISPAVIGNGRPEAFVNGEKVL